MSRLIFERLLDSPQQTTSFAKRIAQILQPGDTVLLSGGIGAGKTHFARSAIQAILTVPEDVPSPTFTLVQTYDTVKGPCWHADLYRIGGPDEIAELGLVEAFENAICLVEWPDRLGSDAPDNALRLAFETGETDDHRTVAASSFDDAWHKRLKDLADA